VPSVPNILPAIHGSEALLKVLSDEGEQSVYLLAINGASKPWVMKLVPRQERSPAEAINAETKCLGRMDSPFLAKVLDFEEIDGDIGVVMEHVRGKSLASICARATERSVLLPPEFGLVVAHDALAATAFFHDFEGAGRVHGNVSPRTIMVGYSGHARLIGYRYGRHPPADLGAQVASDIKPIANIVCDLPLRQFPQQLVRFIPRLLEETISPVEATASTKEFLASNTPTADDRQKVAAWLGKIFPGEEERETRESDDLLAAGLKLIAKASADKKGWAQNPSVGDEIGEYKLVAVLGEGGMGKVYEAEHLKTAKRVALKVLHPRGRTSAIEERFRREAESILRIANPHVVDIERFGPSADGRYLYLAMELLRGESLDRELAKAAPLETLRALRIASQICQALGAAHAAGVIHRDLKPGNVMLVNRDGNPDFVKVMDFGLARLDMAEAVLTRAGDLIGTFAYMAPEQGQGRPATPKVDIYAAGEILYEMLTRRRPHEGSEDVLVRKATVDPDHIAGHRPDLPEGVGQLVMKALSRDPNGRQVSMAEMGREIDDIVEHLAIGPSRRRPGWLAVGAIAIAVAAAVAAGAALSRRGQGIHPTSDSEHREPPLVREPAPKAPEPTPTPSAEPENTVMPTDVPKLAEPPISLRPKASARDARPTKRKSAETSADQLLQAAETAFDGGNRAEAVRLGTQALKAGGGVRAHLRLAGYYQSMRFFREALEHYRAALKLDPGNSFAAKEIEIVEKRMSSGQ
jgi:eukaryotic-like serine/threonine-protein kinase